MFLSLLLLCLTNICDSVQSPSLHPIIIDAETGSRISEAIITIDDSISITSDWEGGITLPASFSSFTISHEGYLKRHMNKEELTDTILLLNNGRYLDEVVIWGHAPKPQFNFTNRTRTYASSYGSKGGFDFFQTIDDVIHYKRNKKRKRTRDIVSKY